MLNVLIADDEAKVVQLIKLLVDWKSYGMNIIATANDGQEALNIIIAQQPDVVVTDIRMPSVSGIELIEKSQEAGLRPYFVIISGYNDFKYAQRGIQLGVEDYLLKPLKKRDLENVLEKIQNKNNIERQTHEEKNELISALSQSKKLVKGRFLTDVLVSHDLSLLDMTPEDLSEKYGLLFSAPYMECIVTHIYTNEFDDTPQSKELCAFILPKIFKLQEECLSERCTDTVSIIVHNEVICLINFYVEDQQAIHEALINLSNSLVNYRSIYPNLQIATGVSRPFTSFRLLIESFHDAQNILFCRFARKNNRLLLMTEDNDISNRKTPTSLSANDRKSLIDAIELIDIHALETVLNSCFTQIRDVSDISATVSETWNSLCETVLYGIRSLTDVSQDLVIIAESLHGTIDRIYSLDTLRNEFSSVVINLLTRYENEKRSLEDKPIREAKKYIQQHYSEALSLELVSREVGFNPAYLSTIFKKSTGQNFLDYVKEVRIEKAKDKLIHTNMDLASIAAAVGYTDVKYFTRLFHKATHLTPNDYRKLYG